jgi:hypothetical protein
MPDNDIDPRRLAAARAAMAQLGDELTANADRIGAVMDAAEDELPQVVPGQDLSGHTLAALAKHRRVEYLRVQLAREAARLVPLGAQVPPGEALAYAAAVRQITDAADALIAAVFTAPLWEAAAKLTADAEQADRPGQVKVTYRAPGGANDVLTLTAGHDYVIRHQVKGVQRYQRQSRMGFMGRDHAGRLLFTGRGPNDTQDAPYGGTQAFEARWITGGWPVDRDVAARYLNGRVPGGEFTDDQPRP